MSNILILSLKEEDYLSHIIKIIKENKKIGYVTFNKSYKFILELFEKKKIDSNQFYFIDCISASIKKTKNIENIEFISNPGDLAKINSSVKKIIEKGYNLIIFDFFSDILIYNPKISDKEMIKFIKSFSGNLSETNGKAIFIYDRNKESMLSPDFLSVFDKFIKSFKPLGL